MLHTQLGSWGTPLKSHDVLVDYDQLNDLASHLEELRGVLLDGPEESEALLLVVHDGPTRHPARERERSEMVMIMIGL